MFLTDQQYDDIIRSYFRIQSENRSIFRENYDNAYNKIPDLKKIDDEITTLYSDAAFEKIDNNNFDISNIEKKVKALRKKQENLLLENGFPKNQLMPIYTCNDCKDTGFIKNKRCHCLEKKILDAILKQSGLTEELKNYDFKKFSLSYYSPTVIDTASHKTELELAKKAISGSKLFIKNLTKNLPVHSLLFYGNPGVGKTFLLNCIANELMQKGIFVVYFTAGRFFDEIRKSQLASTNSFNSLCEEKILNSDVLILDDLGTENITDFSRSQLFSFLNEQLGRNKPVLISTNLNPWDISELYSERIFSRIAGNFELLKLCGDDIRLSKKSI